MNILRSMLASPLPFWKMANRASFATAHRQPAATSKASPVSMKPVHTTNPPVDSDKKPKSDRGPLGTEDTLAALRAAYGSMKGDKAFREDLDFDQDGEIGIGDYSILSAKATQSPKDEFELLREAYGKSKGEEGFNETVDFNKDGEVDIADYALLSQRRAMDRDLAAMKAAYGAFAGDQNFDKNLDLDGDGEIGIGDYSLLSQRYA